MTFLLLLFTLANAAWALDAGPVPSPVDQARQAYYQGDRAQALRLLEPALRAGDAQAHWLKAQVLGLRSPEARAHIQAAAEHPTHPHPDAMSEWAVDSIRRGFVAHGMELLDGAARRGSLQAAYTLGRVYSRGIKPELLKEWGIQGPARDYEKALAYYRLAGDAGHARSLAEGAALCTTGGPGLSCDPDKARELLAACAQCGPEGEALARLGTSHLEMIVQGKPVAALPAAFTLRVEPTTVVGVDAKRGPGMGGWTLAGLWAHEIGQPVVIRLRAVPGAPPGVYEGQAPPWRVSAVLVQSDKDAVLETTISNYLGALVARIPARFDAAGLRVEPQEITVTRAARGGETELGRVKVDALSALKFASR